MASIGSSGWSIRKALYMSPLSIQQRGCSTGRLFIDENSALCSVRTIISTALIQDARSPISGIRRRRDSRDLLNCFVEGGALRAPWPHLSNYRQQAIQVKSMFTIPRLSS
jgi:hypothetical protein